MAPLALPKLATTQIITSSLMSVWGCALLTNNRCSEQRELLLRESRKVVLLVLFFNQ